MSGLLILDFDGTLCLGDEPVRAYARAVADEAGIPHALVLDPLDAFLAADTSSVDIVVASDGYQATAELGRRLGLDAAALGRAYRASRADVDAGLVPMHAAPGMADELAHWTGWRRVLVTNAPDAGTRALVSTLGFAGVVDHIIGDAGKPRGLEALLAEGGELHRAVRTPLASVGDIWRNDLAPVAAVSGWTALIDRHPQVDAAPTVRARQPQDALRKLRECIQGAETAP